MKNLKNLGQALSKNEQRLINGGSGKGCLNPYFNNEPTCLPGYHPHPIHGICICCQDQ